MKTKAVDRQIRARVARHAVKDNYGGQCRVCKCTEERACDNGCGWAGPGLCTNCAEVVEALAKYVHVAYSFNQTGLMRELYESERRAGMARKVRTAGGAA